MYSIILLSLPLISLSYASASSLVKRDFISTIPQENLSIVYPGDAVFTTDSQLQYGTTQNTSYFGDGYMRDISWGLFDPNGGYQVLGGGNQPSQRLTLSQPTDPSGTNLLCATFAANYIGRTQSHFLYMPGDWIVQLNVTYMIPSNFSPSDHTNCWGTIVSKETFIFNRTITVTQTSTLDNSIPGTTVPIAITPTETGTFNTGTWTGDVASFTVSVQGSNGVHPSPSSSSSAPTFLPSSMLLTFACFWFLLMAT
ncbi:hypothetical protein SISNIDRAFT_483450 [Sistotremastrum niveocremeum HHB9708]|uniref:Concanavalin A-like lectin/glucanase n=1 Tax=Sistotremastrum niveocremeum HHB9708 TaxID=1314777 RepID=A0A164XJQ0_9AGAM|nr:hypothetical protein SISNIDRAFT_483450 [Sistotremastrum niveocremeum HHB9708]